jgi:hypothetical protein
MALRPPFAHLRAAIEKHAAECKRFEREALTWLELAAQATALDAREVALDYLARRAKGERHKEAVQALALKHERTVKRIEQLVRTGNALDAVTKTPHEK